MKVCLKRFQAFTILLEPRKLISNSTDVDTTWFFSFAFTSTDILLNLDKYVMNVISEQKKDVPMCVCHRSTRYHDGRLIHWYWYVGYASGPNSSCNRRFM